MKKYIFAFVLGGIVFSSISLFAYSYNAKDIVYTPSNTSWNVNSVKSAIDSIKNTNDITISGLENDISTKNATIESLNNQISVLENKKPSIEEISKYFDVNSINIGHNNTYTATKKGKVLISIAIHSGLENVDSKSSYSVKKNNVVVNPTYTNSPSTWNRSLYYIIEVEKDDVISYSVTSENSGNTNVIGLYAYFVSN